MDGGWLPGHSPVQAVMTLTHKGANESFFTPQGVAMDGDSYRSERDEGIAKSVLLPQHRLELKASGLNDETIATNGIYSESDPKKIAKLLNWSAEHAAALGPALVYPHHGRDGHPLGHATVKPDRPREGKDKPGKTIKYENPKAKSNRVFIPAGARAALTTASAILFITEGCKKALAATQFGFPCLSIPGVWGWCQRPKRDGKRYGPVKLNADLAGIDWKGLKVYIAFDSDLATNPNVRLADWRLAEMLRARGAEVRVVRLPAEPDGSKNGLDDFLVRRGSDSFKLLVETAQPPAEPERPKKDKARAAADVALGIGLSAELWHDSTNAAFATVGRHTHAIRSKSFRQWLVNEYRRESGGKVANSEVIANALNSIEASAVLDGPERPAFVRIAGHGECVYLHLADAEGTVIEIDADGWRVCDHPPVHFRKSPGMLPLPMPQRGGKIDGLRAFLNLADDDAFALVKAAATSAFRPDGPFPLLVLMGEQGSCKTTTGRVLKRLIDPSAAPDRGAPRDERDLMIRCRGNWLLPYDNLSHLPDWLSDALCRLATGGGFSTRELYSNEDEVIFDAKRPLVLNGITEFVERSDLLERSLLIRHPYMPDEKRRPEKEFWAAFEAALPKLLGALLDRVSAGMRELPKVKLSRLPRMADFALFAVACEQGAGEEKRFEAAYADNQSGAREQVLDISPVSAILVAMMGDRPEWEGSASELLQTLNSRLPTGPGGNPAYPADWPKKPASLSNMLLRLTPDLRRVHGFLIEVGRKPGGKRTRYTRITRAVKPETDVEMPSRSSLPSLTEEESDHSQEKRLDAFEADLRVPLSQSSNESSRPTMLVAGVVPEPPITCQQKTLVRDEGDDGDDAHLTLSGSQSAVDEEVFTP